MMRRKLSDLELSDALETLPGWSVQEGKLTKQFKFSSFAVALGWMVTVGVAADKMDHHPEWRNVYNRVDVVLSTHDMDNAISTWDVALARIMDDAASPGAGGR